VSPDPEGPVCGVTWYNAVRYCRWLSAKEGMLEDQQCYGPVTVGKNGDPSVQLKAGYLLRRGYRLPTEAEWEYAARAGTVTPRYYGWTDAILGDYEWCHLQLSYEAGSAQPVGRLLPNPLGMFDMLGNVSEWSANYIDRIPEPGNDGLVPDPEMPGEVRGQCLCVVRGGGRNDVPGLVYSSLRFTAPASVANHRIGFRIARTLP
jgi:formylglycine-generating enzyme required for sulfatase activity